MNHSEHQASHDVYDTNYLSCKITYGDFVPIPGDPKGRRMQSVSAHLNGSTLKNGESMSGDTAVEVRGVMNWYKFVNGNTSIGLVSDDLRKTVINVLVPSVPKKKDLEAGK